MPIDKKRLSVISISIFIILLLLSVLVPNGSGRIAAALVLLPASVIFVILVKKRRIPSVYRKDVLMLLGVIGAVSVMLHYLSGLSFEFSYSEYPFSIHSLFFNILPIAVIVVSSEMLRGIIIAGESRLANVFGYLALVVAEVLTVSGIAGITSVNKLMDVAGLAFLPAITANLLYHYLARRYGILPNILFRLITSLYTYIIPITPKTPDSLLALARLLIPLGIYLFIDMLYEKRKRYAKERKPILSYVLTGVVVLFLSGFIMLVSCQFRFGALVVGSDSMTGEINVGDTIIYERYEDQMIDIGQVIVFKKGDSRIIHRVVDIERVNGELRYYTKGDANDSQDAGYITDESVIGLTNWKIPYVGYPTIWMRNIFNSNLRGGSDV